MFKFTVMPAVLLVALCWQNFVLNEGIPLIFSVDGRICENDHPTYNPYLAIPVAPFTDVDYIYPLQWSVIRSILNDEWKYLSIYKLQWCNRWSLAMDK